jgi:hypothetical protein
MAEIAHNMFQTEGYCCLALSFSFQACNTSIKLIVRNANATMTGVTARTRGIVQDHEDTIVDLLHLLEKQNYLIMLQDHSIEAMGNFINGFCIILVLFVVSAISVEVCLRVAQGLSRIRRHEA